MVTIASNDDSGATCLCCGAQAGTSKEIRHDELCSYNNTKQAFTEFLPEDFILGDKTDKSAALRRQCITMAGRAIFDKVVGIVDRLLKGTLRERINQCKDLGEDTDFDLTPMELWLVSRVSALKEDHRDMLINYLIFKAANKSLQQELHDEHYRQVAREEVLSKAFIEAFNLQLG